MFEVIFQKLVQIKKNKILTNIGITQFTVDMHVDKQYKGHEIEASCEDNLDRFLKQCTQEWFYFVNASKAATAMAGKAKMIKVNTGTTLAAI